MKRECLLSSVLMLFTQCCIYFVLSMTVNHAPFIDHVIHLEIMVSMLTWKVRNIRILWYLQIDGATAEHEGSYLCSISNVLEERWTEPVDVEIGRL